MCKYFAFNGVCILSALSFDLLVFFIQFALRLQFSTTSSFLLLVHIKKSKIKNHENMPLSKMEHFQMYISISSMEGNDRNNILEVVIFSEALMRPQTDTTIALFYVCNCQENNEIRKSEFII